MVAKRILIDLGVLKKMALVGFNRLLSAGKKTHVWWFLGGVGVR